MSWSAEKEFARVLHLSVEFRAAAATAAGAGATATAATAIAAASKAYTLIALEATHLW